MGKGPGDFSPSISQTDKSQYSCGAGQRALNTGPTCTAGSAGSADKCHKNMSLPTSIQFVPDRRSFTRPTRQLRAWGPPESWRHCPYDLTCLNLNSAVLQVILSLPMHTVAFALTLALLFISLITTMDVDTTAIHPLAKQEPLNFIAHLQQALQQTAGMCLQRDAEIKELQAKLRFLSTHAPASASAATASAIACSPPTSIISPASGPRPVSVPEHNPLVTPTTARSSLKRSVDAVVSTSASNRSNKKTGFPSQGGSKSAR